MDLVLPSVQGTVAKVAAPLMPEGWRLRVKAYAGKYRDEYNWAGALEGATDALDRMDFHEPPPGMEPGVRLYFTDEHGAERSCDYRALGQDAYRWEIVVESEETVHVQVDEVDRLPKAWRVFLIDEVTQERYDLRASPAVTLPMRGGPASRHLVLWAGASESASAVIPTAYRLFPNAPNPFNAATALRYTLPEAGIIRLTIYGIDGQVVRTLVQEKQEAGWHRVIWDGRDTKDDEVASGLYLGRLSVGSFEAACKLMLVR